MALASPVQFSLTAAGMGWSDALRRLWRKAHSVLGALVLGSSACTHGAELISAWDAAKYVGQEKTVCGIVASTKYAEDSTGQPNFLNLDRPYPDHLFYAVIWGPDRHRFAEPPEAAFIGKSICVSGYISTYDDRPQIFVNDPEGIQVGRAEASIERGESVSIRKGPDGRLLLTNSPISR